MRLLIYTPLLTNRIQYICKFIFSDVLGAEIEITSNKQEFLSSANPKASYANEPIVDELFFKRDGFLSQEGAQPVDLHLVEYKTYSVPFAVEGSVLPFDVFAAAFYLLTRYEEYLPHSKDQHGRFRAEESFAFKAGFLRLPVIDQWAYEIAALIRQRYSEFTFPARQYSYIPTIDIDRAYAWRYSSLPATAARLLKATLSLRKEKARSIIRVLIGKEKDPFDTYDLMRKIHQNARPVFFFLMGDCSRYDNSISCELPEFRRLIKDISSYADVGVHPSYKSNIEPERTALEKRRLEEIVDHKVVKSRQHFLKMKMSETYQRLLQEGIEEDYSMGFASQAGFRAGTCMPFHWYDLSQEKETSLTVYPFVAMEVKLSKYMRLNPEQALNTLKNLCDEVKKVNGTFITLWHNESLTDTGYWKGWLNVYQQIVQYASDKK
jgi:hypothetical protein